MRRREFLCILGAAAGSPKAAFAQRHIPIVGFVGFASASVEAGVVNAFRQALADLGYLEGRTISILARHADGEVQRGLAIIDELAAIPADVLFAPGPAAARAVVRKTKIPVVAIALPAVQSDPELFQSLARPGGSLTGFSAFGEEMSAKRISMLKEILPGLKRLGVMHNATDPTFNAWGEQTMADTKRLGIEPVRAGLVAPSPAAVIAQFEMLAKAGGTAMIVIRDYMTAAMINDICRAGLASKIAVIGEQAEVAQAGALFSYGGDVADLARRAAVYVDHIIKGRKAAEMPIQLPTKFELTLNLNTARTLGLTIPATILALSDTVIE